MKPWLQAITRRIRQNHALEHATMHLLARTQGPLRLVGRSDWRGFWLYGVVPTEAVRSAAHEALARLHAGEADMAVHARCGTNIVVAALLAGTGVALASAAVRAGSTPSGGFRRWAATGAALLAALRAAPSLGRWVQRRWMTTADLSDVRSLSIERDGQSGLVVHRILIRHA